eukprot:9589249-Heterocapsa_arctica.AAC.1
MPPDTTLPGEFVEPQTLLQQRDIFHIWLLRFGYGWKCAVWVEELHTFQEDMNFANIKAKGILDPHQGPLELAAKFGLEIISTTHGDIVKQCIAFPSAKLASDRIEQLQPNEPWE